MTIPIKQRTVCYQKSKVVLLREIVVGGTETDVYFTTSKELSRRENRKIRKEREVRTISMSSHENEEKVGEEDAAPTEPTGSGKEK